METKTKNETVINTKNEVAIKNKNLRLQPRTRTRDHDQNQELETTIKAEENYSRLQEYCSSINTQAAAVSVTGIQNPSAL